MQKHVLSKKDAKEFLGKIKQLYNLDLEGTLEIGKEKKAVYYFVNGVLAFFNEDPPLPTVCGMVKLKVEMPYVVVDEGAVKAVTRGADLFVPGITEFHCQCRQGDYFAVKTKTGIPIAVMRALMDAETAQREKKGKFGENLHYMGDEIWEMCKGALKG